MKYVFSTLILLCLSFHSFAQKKTDAKLEELEQRMKELEVEKKGLEQRLKSVSDDYERKAEILESGYNSKHEAFVSRVDNQNTAVVILTILATLLGFGSLLIVLQYYSKIRKDFNEEFKNNIVSKQNEIELIFAEKLKGIVAEEENKVIKLIERENDEWKARGQVKIALCYVKNEGAMLELLSFLGFKNVTLINVSGEDNLRNLNSDIVIFNSPNNEFGVLKLGFSAEKAEIDAYRSNDLIIQLIAKQNPQTLFFYYNKNDTKYPLNALQDDEVMSFANSKPAIYHNLLDLAVYWYKFIRN